MRVRVEDGLLVVVTVDGIDVTNRCWEADDAAGYARCHALDAEGHTYVVGDAIAQETLRGVVVIDVVRQNGVGARHLPSLDELIGK